MQRGSAYRGEQIFLQAVQTRSEREWLKSALHGTRSANRARSALRAQRITFRTRAHLAVVRAVRAELLRSAASDTQRTSLSLAANSANQYKTIAHPYSGQSLPLISREADAMGLRIARGGLRAPFLIPLLVLPASIPRL